MKLIGLMTERIELQQYTESGRDGFNFPEGTWNTVATVWADVTQNGSNETEGTDVIRIEDTYNVRIRLRTNVTANDRLIWRGRTLQITGVQHDRRQSETNIAAQETN